MLDNNPNKTKDGQTSNENIPPNFNSLQKLEFLPQIVPDDSVKDLTDSNECLSLKHDSTKEFPNIALLWRKNYEGNYTADELSHSEQSSKELLGSLDKTPEYDDPVKPRVKYNQTPYKKWVSEDQPDSDEEEGLQKDDGLNELDHRED